MPELTRATLADALAFLVELVAMVLLSTIGFFAERAGLSNLASGLDPLSVWLLGVGAVALYAGVYMVGYQRVLPRLRTTVGGQQA